MNKRPRSTGAWTITENVQHFLAWLAVDLSANGWADGSFPWHCGAILLLASAPGWLRSTLFKRPHGLLIAAVCKQRLCWRFHVCSNGYIHRLRFHSGRLCMRFAVMRMAAVVWVLSWSSCTAPSSVAWRASAFFELLVWAVAVLPCAVTHIACIRH